MIPSLIFIGLLVAVGLVLWLVDGRNRSQDGTEQPATPQQDCSAACCSTNEICPSEQVAAAQCGPVVYYDDEELDLYRGRGSDDYTDGEVEQWRDVLMTLQPHEVLPWGQSVKRRGLVMPTAIHEEFMLLASDTQ